MNKDLIIAKQKELIYYLFRQLKKRYPLFRSAKLDELESELSELSALEKEVPGKEDFIEKLNHVIHNLTLIQWTDLEGEMTPINSELIRQEIKQLESIRSQLTNKR
jgi:hypothetical protein